MSRGTPRYLSKGNRAKESRRKTKGDAVEARRDRRSVREVEQGKTIQRNRRVVVQGRGEVVKVGE